jgi:hypothetical protein
MEIFNEITISIALYTCYLFTDFINKDTRYTLGWVFVGIVFFNLFVNLVAILIISAK